MSYIPIWNTAVLIVALAAVGCEENSRNIVKPKPTVEQYAFITTTDFQTGSASVVWLDGAYTIEKNVAAIERLWSAKVSLLITVAEKGGGYINRIKSKPGARLINVTPANRDGLPDRILAMLAGDL